MTRSYRIFTCFPFIPCKAYFCKGTVCFLYSIIVVFRIPLFLSECKPKFTGFLSECLVGGLSIDQYQFGDAPETTIEFPCGIAYGSSSLEDVKAAYGEPTRVYEGDLYTNLTYEYDYNQSLDFYIDNETGVLNDFEIENFVADAEANAAAAAEVSSEPTAEVLAYQAPEELGDDLLSFTVDYAGNLYQLPGPVSIFIENGWTLKENDSDAVVA